MVLNVPFSPPSPGLIAGTVYGNLTCAETRGFEKSPKSSAHAPLADRLVRQTLTRFHWHAVVQWLSGPTFRQSYDFFLIRPRPLHENHKDTLPLLSLPVLHRIPFPVRQTLKRLFGMPKYFI